MIVKYLLAVFLFGSEATHPPTIVAPFGEADQCQKAAAEMDAEIKRQGAAGQAYAAWLKIEHGARV